MLKGKTKIELIDTRNGHIDTYENTNMFTNGIQELLSYTSVLDNNKFQSNINSSGQAVSNYNGVLGNDEYPTINYFTGGLLLLQDYVNEDANMTSIPSNNKVIGRACLENNESTQNGSRNGSCTSKEFVNGKTYKYVWEFNEAQANGTISCVSLTTPLGATSAPLDSEETISHPNKYPYTQNQFKCVCDGKGNSSNSIMQGFKDESYFSQKLIAFIDGTNNCYYCFSSNSWDNSSTPVAQVRDVFKYWADNKKILLTKYRLPYNNFSIFDNRKNYWGEGTDDVDRILEKIEIDIPNNVNLSLINFNQTSANQTSARMSVCNDDNYLYILLTNSAKTQGEVTSEEIRDTINNETSFNNLISFNSNRTNSGLLCLMKIDINSFTMEAIDLLGLDANICSWLGSAKDFYKYNSLSSGLTQRHYNINLINDIYVFNDYLYFFKKENINFSNRTFDLVLYRVYINDVLNTLEKIKYNGEDIVINCAVYDGDDKEPYNIVNENRRFCGRFLNKYFSLGVPFVSMISNGKNLFVTFIENKKTFMIGDTTAYLLNENNNSLFNIKVKENLDSPVYPQTSTYCADMYNSQYWKTGNNPLYFVYTPSAEKLFYIVGGNGKILKSSDTETKLVKDDDDFLVPYSTFNFYKEKGSWDSGCYDILRDSTPLITINNLENQIEKKPYQKMKVTYTITEV